MPDDQQIQHQGSGAEPPPMPLKRLPREHGYGDFCFDSIRSRKESYCLSTCDGDANPRLRDIRKAHTRLDIRRADQKKLVDLKISNAYHFPFLDLPITVRERVYWWIGMFHSPDESHPLELRVQRFATKFSPRTRLPQSLDLHPARLTNYLVTPMMAKQHASNLGKSNLQFFRQCLSQREAIKTVRNLSNVSSEIRRELGQFLWRKVNLTCDYDCYDQFVSFVKDRPAIWPGIKSLAFTIHLLASFVLIHQTSEIEDFFQTIIANLDLETLKIGIYVRETYLRKIIEFHRGLEFLKLFKKMRVSKTFEVHGSITLQEKALFQYDFDGCRAIEAALWEKWYPEIKQALMPLSLQSSGPINEEEKYLQARQALMGRS